MKLELRLAWRNIWRNGRRTGLTLAATFFAVVLVVVFVAMAAGVHGKMIEDSVRLHSGHLQIAGAGWLEHRTLEQNLRLDPPLVALLDHTPGVTGWAPRISGFALLSHDSATQGVALLGVDPAREAGVSTLLTRTVAGGFGPPGARPGIVLGEQLARNLGVAVGDELLVYSVAYSLEMAYELFTVVGIVRLPEPSLDQGLAVIRLADAQRFFVFDDRVTEVALLLRDADALGGVRARLASELPAVESEPLELHPWTEVMPELEQLIVLDDAGMYVMLVILVVVVGFGILNTLLMSVMERQRELGVMLALGLRPAALFRLVYVESMLLAAIGLLLGLAFALPLVAWLQGHPIPLGGDVGEMAAFFGIDPVVTWKLKPLNPIGSAITIFAVAALAALRPALRASRARPVDALRGL